MSYLKYQSSEWVEIQKEMHEDQNAKSIMDEFKNEYLKLVAKRSSLFLTTNDIIGTFKNVTENALLPENIDELRLQILDDLKTMDKSKVESINKYIQYIISD